MSQRMLKDPPDLWQHAKHVDPPVGLWPGEPIGRQRLKESWGDEREWFRYGHRLGAAERMWVQWARARVRRRNLSAGWSWNQVLIVGEYGASKTTLGNYLALNDAERGHPLFFNADLLWGWELQGRAAYTAMSLMPKYSWLLWDEASSALPSRLNSGVFVTIAGDNNLNTRKIGARVAYMSAQDREVAPKIRQECYQVMLPVKVEGVVAPTSGGEDRRPSPANDPDNFRLIWHVWSGFPFKRKNLIEGTDVNQKTMGKPDFTMYAHGERVRRAFLLNDTWRRAQPGAAYIENRDDLRDDLITINEGGLPNGNGKVKGKGDLNLLMDFFLLYEQSPPDYFSPGEIAMVLEEDDLGNAGRRFRRWFPVKNYPRRGYKAEEIYRRVYDIQAEMEANGRGGLA